MKNILFTSVVCNLFILYNIQIIIIILLCLCNLESLNGLHFCQIALYVLLLVISSVAFSDLRDNMEAAASVYSQAAGLILGDDFTLLQVHQWGLCVIILYCVILRVYMCVCVC